MKAILGASQGNVSEFTINGAISCIILTAKRKEEIEEEAQLVSDYYYTNDKPIRPEEIAKAEGITFSLNNYNNNFKGLIHYTNGKFHIYLDNTFGATLKAPIVRYSFAHELGHYFIDEQRAELIKLGMLPQSDNVMLAEDIFEKEAEYFAGCLLMPRERFLSDISENEFSTWLIHQVCKSYQVSQTAALMRYMALGEIAISVITNFLDGKHDKVMHSKHFPHHSLNLDENGYISPESVAGRYCYKGIDDFKTEKLLAANIWFNPKSEEDALRVYREECLIQPKLNRVVSIVYEKKFV